MKHYLSVWMLYVKSSIYQVLGIIIIMAAVETALFEYVLKQAVTAAVNGTDLYGYSPVLETVFVKSRIFWVCAAAFILLSVVLLTACGEYGSATGYTLRRLQIPDKAVFLMQTAANGCFYLLFFAVQVVLTFVLAKHYTMQPELYVTNQTIPLTYYGNTFLHGLLPLSDVFYSIRNILAWIGLSVAAACYPILRRRGKIVPEAILWIGASVLCFPALTGQYNAAWILILLVLDVEMLIRIWRKEAVLDEE